MPRTFTLADITQWLKEERAADTLKRAEEVLQTLLNAQIVTLMDGAASRDWSG